MRRKLLYCVLLLPAFLLAGCQNEIDGQGPEAGSPTTFTATIEGGDATKTTLGALSGNERPVYWSDSAGNKDSLYIGGAIYRISAITSTDSRSATFSGSGATKTTISGTEYYEAFYPASIYSKTGNTVTLRLPATQQYKSTLPAEGNRVVISHLPMYARSMMTNLNFYNLCAVLNFKLKGTDKVTKVVVTSATKKLNGSFTPAADGTAYKAQMSDSTPTTEEKKVELDCTGGVAGGYVQLGTQPTEFCIAVPPADYPQNDLTVEVYGYKGSNTTTEVLLMPAFKNTAAAGSQLKRSEIYDIEKEARVFSVTYNGVTTSSAGTPVVSPDIITLSDYERFTFSEPFLVTANADYRFTVKDDTGYEWKPINGGSDHEERPTIVKNLTCTLPAPNFQEKPFTVSMSGTRVYFSPGNLQYRASKKTWRFADNQLDYVGDNYGFILDDTPHGTVYQGGVKSGNHLKASNYDGWIDIFGWGTTGINYRSLSTDEYQPWTTSRIKANYGPVYNASDLAASSLSVLGQSDWGVNEIRAGSTVISGGTYRTPTGAEWKYVMNNTSYLFAELPFGRTRTLTLTFALIEDPSYAVSYQIIQPGGALLKGLILFPDGFMEDYAALVSSYPAARIGPGGAEKEQWTEVTNWPALEAAGCVFLPSSETGGHYWSATSLDSFSKQADGISYGGGVGTPPRLGPKAADRHHAYLVRLVKDITP